VPQEVWNNALFSLAPTVLVGLVFWFIMAAIIRSDRSERSARAKIEAEERAKRAQPPTATPSA
jgi:flagellar biosynthesis/type III secretory pathway M-ring protein FliF/YscJ